MVKKNQRRIQSTPPEQYKLPNGWWLLDAYHLGREQHQSPKKKHYDVYWCPDCSSAWQPNWSHVWTRGKKTYAARVEYLDHFQKRYLKEKICQRCK